MPSVLTKKIQRAFIYLLATVGIIFLILLLTRQIREGFQTPPEPTVLDLVKQRKEDCIERLKPGNIGATDCENRVIEGKNIFLCETEGAALNILACDETFAETLIPNNIPILKLGESVCFMNELSNLYVCYNRPPLIGFDTLTNMNQFQNPSDPDMDDPVPRILEAQIPGICSGYQASYTMLHNSISTISTNVSHVNGNMAVIRNVYDTLQSLKTIHCNKPSYTNSNQSNACNLIDSNVGMFNTILTSPNTSNISTLMNTSLSGLHQTLSNELIPAYNGFDCTKPTFR